jgi:hypothetical protein
MRRLALKNAILLNSKRNHGRQHFVRNCEPDIFAYNVNTLMIVTNHYKHFDSLLARMISIVDRVGDALDEEEFDTSGETDTSGDDTFSEHNSDIFSETSSVQF